MHLIVTHGCINVKASVELFGGILDAEKGTQQPVMCRQSQSVTAGRRIKTIDGNEINSWVLTGHCQQLTNIGTSHPVTLASAPVDAVILDRLQMFENGDQAVHQLNERVEMIPIEPVAQVGQVIFDVARHCVQGERLVQRPSSHQHSSGATVETGDAELAILVARLVHARPLHGGNPTVFLAISTEIAGDQLDAACRCPIRVALQRLRRQVDTQCRRCVQIKQLARTGTWKISWRVGPPGVGLQWLT